MGTKMNGYENDSQRRAKIVVEVQLLKKVEPKGHRELSSSSTRSSSPWSYIICDLQALILLIIYIAGILITRMVGQPYRHDPVIDMYPRRGDDQFASLHKA